MNVDLQHTKAIFRHLVTYMPPFVPEDIMHDARLALEQVEHNESLTREELEDTIVMYGKKLWPYRMAFDEFEEFYSSKMGEKIFSSKLPSSVRTSYLRYIAFGGSFRDLRHGKVLTLFSSEERLVLSQSMVDTEHDVHQYTRQAIFSIDEERYVARIVEFLRVMENMETEMQHLRAMADAEQKHPSLAAEIREHVRGFEFGLSALGPKTHYAHIMNAQEHFVGRRHVKDTHQSIFYS